MVTTNVVYRPDFEFLFTDKTPNQVVVAGRSLGKTYTSILATVHDLLSDKMPTNSTAIFAASALTQAKTTVAKPMNALMEKFPKNFCEYNKSEGTYYFNLNKTDVRKLMLVSYAQKEKIRGQHVVRLVLDECADMPPQMLDDILFPTLTLAHNQGIGKLLAIGTVKGKNKLFELYQRGLDPAYPKWSCHMVKASESSLYSPETLEMIKSTISPESFAREYECDFEADALGDGIFIEYIRRFCKNNIDDKFDYDPYKPVYTAWDVGISDNTAIWFFQTNGSTPTFIDFYENSGFDISHYCGVLLSKPYTYHTAILPHDAGHRNVRTPSTIDAVLNAHKLNTTILPPKSVMEGINSARTILKNCFFHKTKCQEGIQHLKNYKFKTDWQTGKPSNTPLHDIHSDCADAFRYAAVSQHIWAKSPNQFQPFVNTFSPIPEF